MMRNFSKKLVNLTLALFLLSTVTANAQYQLPNAGFEAWNSTWNGKPQPDSWNLSNVSQAGFDFNVGERTNDAHTGQYAVRCQGTKVGGFGIEAVSPSWVTLGVAWAYLDGINVGSATAGTTGGIAFTARPDSLAVWMKRGTANGNEDMNIVYYSWHGTATNNKYGNKNGGCTTTQRVDEESDICKSDGNECQSPSGDAVQVAQGWLRSRVNYGNWTLVKVPIKYFNNDRPTKMNIILSGSNYPNKRANSGQYTTSWMIVDDVHLIYSSQIYEMRFNGMAYSKFKKDKYEYTYELTGDEMPVITCFRSDRQLSGSEISIQYGTKDGAPTTITVKAEDGSSTSTYKIYFVSKRDTNQYPTSIKVNGTELSGFNAYVSDYTVSLPYGTEQKPVIDVVKANNKQTVEISDYVIPGTAKVTVYAENTDYSVTYNIKFELKGLSDTTLKDILVNGVSIEGFSPTKTVYKVNVPVGTTGAQQITYVSAYPEGAQTIVVDSRDISETSTVTVSAPEATSSRVYKISYNVTESAYSYLQDLKVGGVTIPGFAPATLSYTYPLPLGTTSVPAVTWTAGDNYQTITKEDGGIDGITKITVKAQNGINTSIYRISFPLTKSSNSKLSDLKVGGVTLPDFSADVTSYSYVLPVGTTELPAVTWTQGDDYQSVKAIYGGVNGTTKIIVTAQDGTVTTYSIAFSVTQATNSTLKDIKVGGESIQGFSPDVTEYSIVLPRGTKVLPEITYTPYDNLQQITKKEGGVNGVTTIRVKAQSGDVTTYSLTFSVEKSDNVLLADIKVGGVTISGFAPDVFEYDYELEAGTTALPEITYTPGDEYQRVYVNKGGVKGVTTLRTIAETGDGRTYSINFSVQKSESANLKNIFIDGVALEGFTPDNYSYTYTLSPQAVVSPAITVEKDGNQDVVITKPQLEGTANIKVVPEEGAVNVYVIKFVSAEGGNCNLADISVNGVTVEGFNPETTEYRIRLAQGTHSLPAISYVKGDEKQRVELVEGGVNGTSTISVMAENGSTKVYYLKFSTEKSSDSLLSDIMLDGVSIEGFNPEVYEYTYYLEKGQACPSVVAVKSHTSSRLNEVIPSFNGDAVFYVTSEDGTERATYTVHFTYKVDTNALLSGISVNGTEIEGFSGDVFDYEVEAKKGSVPVVAYTKATESQIVTLSNDGKYAVITVLAENGSKSVYTVRFTEKAETNALLSDLQLYNAQTQNFESISGFAPETFDYNVTLPKGAADICAVNCVGSNEQSYIIKYGRLGTPTVITVIAADGVTAKDYTVTLNREKSSVCTLDDIKIGGVSVDSFDPEVTSYVVELGNDNKKGVISYLKSDCYSKVVVSDSTSVNASVIKVIAENGDVKTYTLKFKYHFDGEDNTLKSILVNGLPVSGFAADKFDYVANINEGEAPVVTVIKNYNEQRVSVATLGLNKSVITVHSNQDDVDDVIYTVSYNQLKQWNVLSKIEIDGNAIEGFDPYKTKYVVLVNDVPASVIAELPDGTQIAATEQTTNYIRFKTSGTGTLSAVTYDLYLHYTTDVIPNGEFTEWTTASVNTSAKKPVGWTVPADFAVRPEPDDWIHRDNVEYFTTSYPVRQGNGYAELTSVRNYWYLGGRFPGIMSIGSMNVQVSLAGESVTEIGEGITFRNTPDDISFRYNPVTTNSDVIGMSDNIRIMCTLSDGSSTQTFQHTDGTYNNTWKTYTKGLGFNLKTPKTLNLWVNSSKYDNAKSFDKYGSLTNFKVATGSQLRVDYIRLVYSSKINSIKVNGTVAALSGTSATATIDADYCGLPEISITGAVDDQMYNISYGKEVDGVRQVSIRSYAEDMSYTDYTLTVTRPKSSLVDVKSVMVNGAALADFDPSVTEYNVTVPDIRFMPDIVVESASNHQVLNVEYTSGKAVINAQSEDGSSSKTYTINFAEEGAADATLTNISVEGYSIAFTPDNEEYNVELAAGSTCLPVTSFSKKYDAQTVEMTEGGINSATQFVVKLADGSSQKSYKVNFSVLPMGNTSSKLSSMMVTGATEQIAFDPDVKEYTYSKPYDEAAAVAYTREFAEDDMTVTVNSDSVVWQLSNSVSASSNKYKLTFDNVKSNNVKLSDIKLNGVTLEDFNPNVTEYTVPVTLYNNRQIDAYLAEAEQTLSSEYEELTGVYKFTVTAANGTDTQVYTVAIEAERNTNNTLSDIKLDGTSIAEFDPQTNEYNINLPVGTADVPEVWAYGGALGQTLSATIGGINESSLVNVTSESGDENIYVLNFNVTPSDNALLSRISANYEPLPDFEPEKFNYVVEVASGKEDPVITYLKGDSYQAVETETTDNEFIINVTAASGAKNKYVVAFDRKLASGSDLADITLDGVSLEGFAPKNYEYSVKLPAGTVTLPTIETVMGDLGQVITVTTNGLDGDAIINVVSQDGSSTSVYTIHFSVEKSGNADLSMIYTDGVEIEGFNPEQTLYIITLPVGRTDIPEVTYDAGHPAQQIVKSVEETKVTINVKAENGNEKNYIVEFIVVLSTDATLNMIYVDGEQIEGFDKETLEYSVTLPLGTDITKVVVDYDKGTEWQSVDKVPFDGGVDLVVSAQDVEVKQTYKVNLNVEKSTNTALSDLMSGGKTVPDFDPETLDYSIVLPIGTKFIPDVTYVEGDEYQTIEKSVTADSLFFSVKVTAQNMDSRTYTVSYTKELSHDATLKSITLGDERQLIPSFDGDVFLYEVKLPYNAQSVPAIAYEKNDDDQTVETSYTESVTGVSTIKVTAADGFTSNTYTIQFSLMPCNVTTLDMIYYDGKKISDFTPEDNDYEISLPYGTVDAPAVTFDLSEPEHQSASVVTTGTENGWKSVISVKAESGDENEYTVIFTVQPDSETRLSDIKTFGKSIVGFNPEIESYSFELEAYSDSTLLPYPKDVEYVKMSSNETVEVSQPSRESVILKVTAPSGAVRNYVIKTTIRVSDNAHLAAILYKDALIDGFEPDVYEYTIKLPFGSNTIDKELVTYQTQEPGQTVMVVKNNLDVELQVTAQDGETYQIYTIHFVPDDFDPTVVPTQNEVCVTSTADGGWKFTTKCKNLTVIITDLAGRFLSIAELPSVDPNCEDICSPDAEGYVYYGVKNQVVTYNFLYAQKQRVLTGKLRCR